MNPSRRRILLCQLPIPPLGPAPIRGNVPLAPAYLKLYAESKGLASFYEIDILPTHVANGYGDLALAQYLTEREPWLLGFTCYLWNIERTLWIAEELKRRLPRVRILIGGPEITTDNAWVLDSPACDFAIVGEGEQTFAQLLLGLLDGEETPPVPIPGLIHCKSPARLRDYSRREPMHDLAELGSPYVAGILDAADEEMLLLETTRGCVFKCKFCYYPKSYDKQYYLSPDAVMANLRHAQDRGAKEVVLLDPTLNQRRDFADFLRLLARGNPGQRFRYFGELRGEGITPETAALLRVANFTEVEVGLQSTDPDAMTLMDRKNNLRAFERGVRAMLDEGMRVKVDLIIGLPGDTVDSVRRSFSYLAEGELFSDVQVFNLAILPGTSFRQEAAALGLRFQPRPPYYVLQTPTLGREDLYRLMEEAQDLFDVEFDAQPEPVLTFDEEANIEEGWRVRLDDHIRHMGPRYQMAAQCYTLWMKARNLHALANEAGNRVRALLSYNPFTTLQIVLEPDARSASEVQSSVNPFLLEFLAMVATEKTTYLDRFYSLQPGRPNGAKRLIVLLPKALRTQVAEEWLSSVDELATVVWRDCT